MCRNGFNQDVDVIRHHYPGEQVVPSGIEVQECGFDETGYTVVAKGARAVAVIEESLSMPAPGSCCERDSIQVCSHRSVKGVGDPERNHLNEAGAIEVRQISTRMPSVRREARGLEARGPGGEPSGIFAVDLILHAT